MQQQQQFPRRQAAQVVRASEVTVDPANPVVHECYSSDAGVPVHNSFEVLNEVLEAENE